MTVQPPYEQDGLRFETTGYVVFISIPEIRSFVSLSPSFNLVVNLAMEHFLNNTQGQCGTFWPGHASLTTIFDGSFVVPATYVLVSGVCGGASCIRKGGRIEDDTCCEKTALDWLYNDPSKPNCVSAPTNVSCLSVPTTKPPPTCLPNPLCDLLDHL